MRTSQLPEDFELSDSIREWAERTVPQVKVDVEFEKFKDYWLANGKCMANWDATLRNWLRRCVEFKGAALYTRDELRMKQLKAEYMAMGFRAPKPHENSTMYAFEYEVWTRGVRDKPRDMSVVTQLVRAKTA